MPVVLRFGHLADYATADQGGKLVVGGVFDVLNTPDVNATVIPVAFYLVARLECSLADGIDHEIVIKFVDGEEQTIGNEMPLGRAKFQSQGPGRPFAHQIIARCAGVQVAGVGDYRYVISVNGKPAGEIPVFVQLAPVTG